ncbi:MAG: hypothetical protein ACFCGT_16600 [Sandaracinaceae bacterium]
MTRGQRLAHRRLWWVLAPLIVATLIYAVVFRQTVPVEGPPTTLRPARAPGEAAP